MNILDKIEKEQVKSDVTSFNVGDTVKVHCRVIEGGKERVQIFQGIVAETAPVVGIGLSSCLRRLPGFEIQVTEVHSYGDLLDEGREC